MAKARVERLQQLQSRASEAWRQVRWTADVIAQARDRSRSTAAAAAAGFLPLRTLFGAGPHTTKTTLLRANCSSTETLEGSSGLTRRQ